MSAGTRFRLLCVLTAVLVALTVTLAMAAITGPPTCTVGH